MLRQPGEWVRHPGFLSTGIMQAAAADSGGHLARVDPPMRIDDNCLLYPNRPGMPAMVRICASG